MKTDGAYCKAKVLHFIPYYFKRRVLLYHRNYINGISAKVEGIIYDGPQPVPTIRSKTKPIYTNL